jgi:hypothetical protein
MRDLGNVAGSVSRIKSAKDKNREKSEDYIILYQKVLITTTYCVFSKKTDDASKPP